MECPWHHIPPGCQILSVLGELSVLRGENPVDRVILSDILAAWNLRQRLSPKAKPSDGSGAGRKRGKLDFTFFLWAMLP